MVLNKLSITVQNFELLVGGFLVLKITISNVVSENRKL